MFFCESFEISKNTFFYRTPPVAASDITNSKASEMKFRFLRTSIDKLNLQ